ncbi:MAG: hypothetical protein ACI9FB_001817 [Candidatus Azotimanducaceae bacterium]|jgi:hypothetical protein
MSILLAHIGILSALLISSKEEKECNKKNKHLLIIRIKIIRIIKKLAR